jgi:hypothetical protein
MAKIIFPILAVVSLLVLVAGCGPEQVVVEGGKAFIGGDKGLDIQFTEGAPPDVVYDKDFPFDINLRVENIGEWDISNSADATITIIGIEPASFGKTLAQLIQNGNSPLSGARYDTQGNVQLGTIANINFANFQYQTQILGQIELPIVARICYEYGTKVNSKICILDDLFGMTGEGVCNPNEDKAYENSGAPVQIDSFKESVSAADRVTFTFGISHAGTGTVSKTGTECSTTIADSNKVYVKVNTGIAGLQCAGIEGGGSEGYVTLYGAKRTVICNQPLATPRGDFEKPISIEMRYSYSQHVGKTLAVKHIGS